MTHSWAWITSFLLHWHPEFPICLNDSLTLIEWRHASSQSSSSEKEYFRVLLFIGMLRKEKPHTPKGKSFQLHATYRKKGDADAWDTRKRVSLAGSGRAASATRDRMGPRAWPQGSPRAPWPLPPQVESLVSSPASRTAGRPRALPRGGCHSHPNHRPPRSPPSPHQKTCGPGSPLHAPPLTELAS